MTSTNVIEVAGLSVELIRKPIKNLHIGVYPPAGRVRVAAPPAISEDAVRIAVVTRLAWIKKKQREFEGQARQTARAYVSGETHYVFGRPLRLRVKTVAGSSYGVQRDASDRLVMKVPVHATVDQRAHLLTAWYRKELKERSAPRLARWSEELGVAEPRLGIRQMRTKWGSCNPDRGMMWLNLDLAKKPLQALDYVILHEMAHFVSAKHDSIFVGLLDRHMPGWRQIRADLNALPLSS